MKRHSKVEKQTEFDKMSGWISKALLIAVVHFMQNKLSLLNWNVRRIKINNCGMMQKMGFHHPQQWQL